MTKPEVKCSILIGDNLSTDKSFHLLVDKNGIKINKIITPEEYQVLSDVIIALQ